MTELDGLVMKRENLRPMEQGPEISVSPPEISGEAGELMPVLTPPANRAIRWYRMILCLMPTCIAMATLFAGAMLRGIVVWAEPYGWPWWAFNVASTLGLGFFEVQFRPPESRETFESVVTFCTAQLFLIPVILGTFTIILLMVVGF